MSQFPPERQPLSPGQPGGAWHKPQFDPSIIADGQPLYADSNDPNLKAFRIGGYRDWPCAVLFIAHLAAILIVAGINLHSGKLDFVRDDSSSSTTQAPSSSPSTTAANNTKLDQVTMKVVAHSAGAAIGFSFIAIVLLFLIMRVAAKQFIYFANGLIILLFVAAGLFALYEGAVLGGIIMMLFASLISLWLWCVRYLIEVSSLLLKWSVRVTFNYWGTLVMAVLMIAFSIFYVFAWVATAAPTMNSMTAGKNVEDAEDLRNHAGPYAAFIGFALVLFWTTFVAHNVGHMTTAGSAATFFFAGNFDYGATLPSAKRALTTSFGSICFGSLILAILRTIELMVRMAARRRQGIAYCIAMCCLKCIERIAEYVCRYAFIFAAIYGTSFIESSKATFAFMIDGFSFISVINNDVLVGRVFGLSSLMTGAFTGVVNYGIFKHENTPTVVVCVIVGVLVGLVLSHIAFAVAQTGVDTLMVCIHMEENHFRMAHAQDYNELVAALRSLDRGGCGGSDEYSQA